MRHFLIIGLVWMASALAVFGQKKGHKYYNWEGSLGSEFDVDVQIEIDQTGENALGVINYHRKNGKISTISLYGLMFRNDEATGEREYIMEEHLANGKVSGLLFFTLKNGNYDHGEWATTDRERSYTFYVNQVKPFPFSKWSTFYIKGNDEQTRNGVFRCRYKSVGADEAFVQDLIITDTHTTDPDNGAPVIQVDLTLGMGKNVLISSLCPLYDGNKFMLTTQDSVTVEGGIYRDFVSLYTIYYPESAKSSANLIKGSYNRQVGETMVPLGSYDLGMAAHLKDGKVTLSFNRTAIQKALGEDRFPDYYMCPDGRDLEVQGVEGPVRQIFCGDIGQDTNPILALLLADGRVQTLSALETILHGSTTVSQPLPHLHDIVGFTTEKEGASPDDFIDYVTFYALDSEGHTHEIHTSPIAGEWMHNFGSECKGNYTNFTFDEEWNITYHNGPNWGQEGRSVTYCGTYEPMITEGPEAFTLYRYHFTSCYDDEQGTESQPCDIEGTFRATVEPGETDPVITIKPETGLDFSIKRGKSLKLGFIISRG